MSLSHSVSRQYKPFKGHVIGEAFMAGLQRSGRSSSGMSSEIPELLDGTKVELCGSVLCGSTGEVLRRRTLNC